MEWCDLECQPLDIGVSEEQTLYLKQFFRELFGAIVSQTSARYVRFCVEASCTERIQVMVTSEKLDSSDQPKVLTSHLMHRLSKLKGRLDAQSKTDFDMGFSLALS